MNWLAPTSADLQRALLPDEYAAVQALYTADPAALNPIDSGASYILEAVRHFRDAIRSGGKVDMGPDDTLPPGCVRQALNVAAYNFLSALGTKICDARAKLYDHANEYWKSIATGEVVFLADGVSENTASAIRPSTRRRPTRLDPRWQRGL